VEKTKLLFISNSKEMKRFILKSSVFIIPFFALCIYIKFYEEPKWTGDLGRLGKIPFGLLDTISSNEIIENYVVRCKSIKEIINAKNITIGDSFSQQEDGYQLYLSNIIQDSIYNIRLNNLSPEENAIYLLKNNYIPHCKYLIIESVERSCIERLNNLKFNTCKHDSITIRKENIQNSKFMSLTDIASFMRLKLGYKRPYSVAKLTRPLFTHQTFHSSLVFLNSKYDSDLSFIKYQDSMYLKAINNIIKLHDLAKEQNVHLIYLIAANKYDTYSKYIKNNPFPTDSTLNKFIINDDWFINSKKIFQNYLDQGVNDIYYVNDTHWSPIGAKIIGEYIGDIINKMQ
jgi:hypothetical protein